MSSKKRIEIVANGNSEQECKGKGKEKGKAKGEEKHNFRTLLSLNNEQLFTIVTYCQHLIGSCFGFANFCNGNNRIRNVSIWSQE